MTTTITTTTATTIMAIVASEPNMAVFYQKKSEMKEKEQETI